MKVNKRFRFWDAKTLTENLVYGIRKEYDFTFALRNDVQNGYSPVGWHGVKLINAFNSTLPNMLIIGYYDGEDISCIMLDKINNMEQYVTAIYNAINTYFNDNEMNEAYVEAFTLEDM